MEQEKDFVKEIFNDSERLKKPQNDEVKYEWASDARLEISGGEFEWIMSTLNAYLSQPKAQEVLAMVQARTLCEEVMKRGIKSGTITQAQ